MKPAAIAIVFAAAMVAAPADAERVVDYGIDEAQAARNATEQGVPFVALPARGRSHVAIRIDPAVDHDVLRAGIYCSAWKIRNPMTAIVRRFVAAWDRDGAPAEALVPGVDLLVTVDRATTLSRCVGTGEMKSVCITRVSLSGSVAKPGSPPRPFRVEDEAAARGIGLCAGLTRGIGLVSRAATAKLVAEVATQG